MDPRRAAFVAIVVALSMVACQPAAVPPSSEAQPSASASGAIVEPSTPDAGATIDPDWITRPALTCGDPERLFPPEALVGLGLAELGLDPAAALLRSILAEAPDHPFPDSGWHRVLDNPGGVTFVATGDDAMPWSEVTVGLLNGTLQALAYGQCNLAIAAPSGVSFGHWWLDLDGPPVTPESTKLAILIREVDCASGKPPEGRVLRPTIVTTADAFEIAIGIRKQSTAQDCPSNPAHPIELVLPEPIGSRDLFDASQFPPRPVTSEDPG